MTKERPPHRCPKCDGVAGTWHRQRSRLKPGETADFYKCRKCDYEWDKHPKPQKPRVVVCFMGGVWSMTEHMARQFVSEAESGTQRPLTAYAKYEGVPIDVTEDLEELKKELARRSGGTV